MKTARILTRILKRILPVAAILATGLAACQKSPVNGDLDGQWQVTDVTPPVNHPEFSGRLYYCFSLQVCQLTTGPVYTSGNLRFNGDRLSLDFPFATSPEAADSLRWWGINSNPVAFTIRSLDKDRLVMSDGEVTVTMRKF